MTHITQFVCSILVGVSLATAAQADIIVGPEGSGAQTSSINDAIFNADEGETVFVLPGTYDNIQVKRQSVRIIGAGADQVVFAYGGDALFSESSRIFDLTPGQEVFVHGVTFDVLVSSSFEGSLNVFDNQGRVYLHDCEVRCTAGSPIQTLQVSNSSDVRLDQCRVQGFELEGPLGAPAFNSGGTAAIDATLSRLTLNRCEILGGDAAGEGFFIADGGNGITIRDSWLTLHATAVIGGQAFNAGGNPGTAGLGLLAERTQVALTGPPGTTIQGGAGMSTSGGVVVDGAPGLRFVDDISSLVHSSTVDFVAGIGSDGAPAAAADFGGSPVSIELFQRPGLSTSVPSALPGESFDLLADGEPNTVHAVALALSTVPTYGLATAFGEVILDPASTTIMGIVPLGGSGNGSLGLNLPADPALSGVVGWFQGLQTGLGGGAWVSLPAAFVIGL